MTYKNYVNKVLSYIDCKHTVKSRLREDLLLSLHNKSDSDLSIDPIELMGSPKDVALEIIDDQDLRLSLGFDYQSPTEFFGLPLVHITLKKRVVAKGILAIGLRSVGLVSIGVLSLGLLSIGVISLGLLLAIGSISLSVLFSIGSIAVSAYLALGAISVAPIAIGAIAIGDIAVGDIAIGNLALYKSSATGDLTLNIYTQKELIEPALRAASNNSFIIELIKNVTSIM